jgi:hypothetical protein
MAAPKNQNIAATMSKIAGYNNSTFGRWYRRLYYNRTEEPGRDIGYPNGSLAPFLRLF